MALALSIDRDPETVLKLFPGPSGVRFSIQRQTVPAPADRRRPRRRASVPSSGWGTANDLRARFNNSSVGAPLSFLRAIFLHFSKRERGRRTFGTGLFLAKRTVFAEDRKSFWQFCSFSAIGGAQTVLWSELY